MTDKFKLTEPRKVCDPYDHKWLNLKGKYECARCGVTMTVTVNSVTVKIEK